MNSLISRSSQNIFKLAFVLENWVGLPAKVSDSLYFRRGWRKHLLSGIKYPTPSLWIHGASVGELENLANFYLNTDFLKESGYSPDQVVITASSVSAREFLERLQQKNIFRYAGPIPPEDKHECRDFLSILNPEFLVMSHTDLWPCLLLEAQKYLTQGCLWLPKAQPKGHLLEKKILYPLVRTLGMARPNQVFDVSFKCRYVGNPRLDRVYQRISESKGAHPLAEKGGYPKPGHLNVIIGSCWSEDALVWAQTYEKLTSNQKEKLFLVAIPHDIQDTHEVAKIQSIIPWARVITVSGILLESYQFFDLAFVGGGYKSGLHSIVEPALWGLPVACGPLTSNQVETQRLMDQGSLFVAPDSQALYNFLNTIFDDNELKKLKDLSQSAKQILLNDLGATRRLLEIIKQENS